MSFQIDCYYFWKQFKMFLSFSFSWKAIAYCWLGKSQWYTWVRFVCLFVCYFLFVCMFFVCLLVFCLFWLHKHAKITLFYFLSMSYISFTIKQKTWYNYRRSKWYNYNWFGCFIPPHTISLFWKVSSLSLQRLKLVKNVIKILLCYNVC